MFGKKIMLGNTIQTIDEKHRIILPKFTGAEKGDKLVLFQEENFFSIYSLEVLLNQIHQEVSVNLESFLILKDRNDQLSSNVLAIVDVDRYRRVLFSPYVCEKYQLNDKVFISGAIDHINVFDGENEAKRLIKRRNGM